MRRTANVITSSPTPVDPGRSAFVGSLAEARAAVESGVAVVAALTDTPPDPVRRTYDVAAASPDDLPADPTEWSRLIPPLVPAAGHVARVVDRFAEGGWIGLDFDGTLSEIVPEPDAAAPVAGVLDVVADLAGSHRVAIVSGRSLSDLRRRVPVPGVAYAGSHGSEVADRDGTDLSRPISADERGNLDRVRTLMERIVADLPGTEIDEKPTAIAVHTRRATDAAALDIVARRIDADLPDGLQALTGKEVVEVRVAGRHKGDAVAALVGEASAVMYAGDDTTDEDAFAEVRRRLGVPILVGDPADPSTTWASLRVDDPHAVLELLRAFTSAT